MIAFDDFPVVYFSLGYLLAAAIGLLACWKPIKYQELLFLLAAFLLVIFMRLPILVFNQEINPDESQMIAHALTLKQFPVYWQSVDGTTIGPLDNYLLVLPSFVGLPFDYTSARLMGLLCVLASLFFFYLSLKNFFGNTIARIGLLPPLFLLVFAQEGDFVHYSSEQLPLILLNIGLWLLSTLLRSVSLKRIFLLGFVLGLSPFAKIQAVPQAAIIGLFALTFSYSSPDFLKKWGTLLIGGLTFPVIIVLWAAIFGVLSDFWDFYILGNLIYAGGSSLMDAFFRLPSFLAKSPDFLVFLISVGLVSFIAFFKRPKSYSFSRPIFSLVLLWLLASLYAATKSGNDFVHYLNFCIYPFALLGAFLLKRINPYSTFVYASVSAIFLPFFGCFSYKTLQHQPLNIYVSTANHQLPQSEVSKLMLQHAKKGDRLVVWGWMCKYHVETQMPQGAAEAHFERCIYPHSMRDKYYQGLLEDLKNNQPQLFVDAIGPNSLWLNDRTTQAHEAFYELKNIVQNNYTFVGEVENTRVYCHN